MFIVAPEVHEHVTWQWLFGLALAGVVGKTPCDSSLKTSRHSDTSASLKISTPTISVFPLGSLKVIFLVQAT